MDAELLGAHGMEAGKGLSDLGAGHTVLGIAGIVHDLETLPGLAEGEHAAGIVGGSRPFGGCVRWTVPDSPPASDRPG